MISFREKSLWVSLLITLMVAVTYGDNVVDLLMAGADVASEEIVGILIRAVFIFVVLEVVLNIFLAMDEQEGAGLPEDECEKTFRLKANDAGYWVLSVGVVGCIVQHLINNSVDFEAQSAIARFILSPIELKLVVIFWASEVTRFAVEVFHFRMNA